jgi:hypothetical protein
LGTLSGSFSPTFPEIQPRRPSARTVMLENGTSAAPKVVPFSAIKMVPFSLDIRTLDATFREEMLSKFKCFIRSI